MLVPSGVEKEPVYISVIYGDNLQYSQGFSKCDTITEIKSIICDTIRIETKNLRLKRIVGDGVYITL